jgi:hypothetical protein
MLRKLFGLALLCLLPTWLGCALCCGTDDYNYAAYGGRWERHDMTHGRVGSVFAEAGVKTVIEDWSDEPSDESTQEPSDEPSDERRPGDDGITAAETGHAELATYLQ